MDQKMIEEIIRKNRSYRKFFQEKKISKNTLKALINLARLSPSAANLQPLKYVLSNDPAVNRRIFPCLSWAGYLKDWKGPSEGERPSAYVIVLGDTRITKQFGCDHGIAVQSILMGATEKGFGGCIIGAIQRKTLRQNLGIPKRYEILLVLALGVPRETVLIEYVKKGDIRYWRDVNNIHHVPKRRLSDIILTVS